MGLWCYWSCLWHFSSSQTSRAMAEGKVYTSFSDYRGFYVRIWKWCVTWTWLMRKLSRLLITKPSPCPGPGPAPGALSKGRYFRERMAYRCNASNGCRSRSRVPEGLHLPMDAAKSHPCKPPAYGHAEIVWCELPGLSRAPMLKKNLISGRQWKKGNAYLLIAIMRGLLSAAVNSSYVCLLSCW